MKILSSEDDDLEDNFTNLKARTKGINLKKLLPLIFVKDLEENQFWKTINLETNNKVANR